MKSTTLIAILSLTAVHAYSTFGGQRLNTQVSNGGSVRSLDHIIILITHLLF